MTARSSALGVACTCRDCTASAGREHEVTVGSDARATSWRLHLCPAHLDQAIEWALDMRFQFLRDDGLDPDPTFHAFVEFFELQYLANIGPVEGSRR